GQSAVAADRPAVDRHRGVAAVLDVVGGDAAFEIQAQGVGVAERARRHQPHAGPRVAAVHAVEFGLERLLGAGQRRRVDLRQRDQVVLQTEVGGVAGGRVGDVVRLGERAAGRVRARADGRGGVVRVLVVYGAA